MDKIMNALEAEIRRQLPPAPNEWEPSRTVTREGDSLYIVVESDNDSYCSGEITLDLRKLAEAVL